MGNLKNKEGRGGTNRVTCRIFERRRRRDNVGKDSEVSHNLKKGDNGMGN